MGLSTAERNKRKRERKKKTREAIKKQEEESLAADKQEATQTEKQLEVEIEYVPEELAVVSINNTTEKEGVENEELMEQLQKFQAKAITGIVAGAGADENESSLSNHPEFSTEQSEQDREAAHQAYLLSKRKLREQLRPTVAELKRRVVRPDLVEAHDITAADPEFLIQLKATPGTVPVPRHWGRKRKYLQGKRGFEKPPFQLPDFIVQTGITEIRDTVAESEANMSIKQKNRTRIAGKGGAIDVDYRTLHDAFFKYQTKPKNLTCFGDVYYEGKELEVDVNKKSTGKLSDKLREALGMTAENMPPPWLLNMQRYGPPPSYPGLKIPGLNAPLPAEDCQYGFHPSGWGKPPVDVYGRPLYGGNPFDLPGSAIVKPNDHQTLVTSDGKVIEKKAWGTLPDAADDDDEEEEESSEEEDDDMEDSDEEEAAEEEAPVEEGGVQSILPPPPTSDLVNLRKEEQGSDTPAPKALYQVLEQTKAGQQAGAVFTSEVAYAVPTAPEAGAESVLSKAVPKEQAGKRKRAQDDEDDEDDLGKNFKF